MIMLSAQAQSYETETLAYGTTITNNSGTISSNDFWAVDTFVKSAKSKSYWDNVLECSPLAGDQTNAAVAKLVVYPGFPSLLAPSANMASAFYGKTYGWSNSTAGSQRWLSTGYNLNQITNPQPCFGVYITSRPKIFGDGAGGIFGYWFAGPPYCYGNVVFSTDASHGGSYDYGVYWGTNTQPALTLTPSGGFGWYGISQDAAQSQAMWIGADPVSTNAHGFNNTGNANPFKLLTGNSASLNYQGAIGFYVMHTNMSYALIRSMIYDVNVLMNSLGRSSYRAKSLWVVPITGQSLATASGSRTNLSNLYAPFDNFTTVTGPGINSTVVQVGMVPSREVRTFESINTAWMWEAQSLGISNEVSMFSAVNAVGGATYSNYLNQGTAVFSNNLALMTNGLTYTNLYFSNCIVPAVLSIHGESDANNSYYQGDLVQWVNDYGTNAIAVTGQTNQLKMFHSQVSELYDIAHFASSMAMLAEQEKANASNLLVCPKYFLPYCTTNTPHLDEHGYQRLGEYYGKAFYKQFFGGGWEPLRPVDLVRTGAVITVTFTNTTGGLVLDTNTTIYPIYTNLAVTLPIATNYGFTYTDDSSPPAIASVAVTGANSNKVAITLASTPTGGNQIVRYAMWNSGLTGDQGGTTNIQHGNLRNNDPTVGVLSGSNMWDWSVHFAKTNFPAYNPITGINVTNFGAVGDTRTIWITSASNSMSLTTTNTISSSDIGKAIQIFGIGPYTTPTNNQDLVSFVTNQSSGTLVISNNAACTSNVMAIIGTYCTSGFQGAIDASTNGDSIQIPAGNYMLPTPQSFDPSFSMINSTDSRQALTIQHGGITLQGAGAGTTTLTGCGAWLKKGNYVYRGFIFACKGPVTNDAPVVFDGLTMDGAVPIGLTTNHYFPALTTDGSGWDPTHGAVWDTGTAPFHASKTFKNCVFKNWRGEMLKSVVAGWDGFINVTNCVFRDGNATGFNFNFSHTIQGCTFTNLIEALEFYAGYSSNSCAFVFNTVTNMALSLMALNGALITRTQPAYTIASNSFFMQGLTGNGIQTTPAENLSITANGFFSDGNSTAVVLGVVGYQGTAPNSNIVVYANVFSNVFYALQIEGTGSNSTYAVTVTNNNDIYTIAGNSGFATGYGWSTNVLFKNNTSTANFGLNSTALQGQYFIDDLSNQFPAHNNSDSVGVTNVITYAYGINQKASPTAVGAVFVLEDSVPLQIPSSARLVITNTGNKSAPVYLSQTMNGGSRTLTVGDWVGASWTGTAWQFDGTSKLSATSAAFGKAIFGP